MAPRSWPKRSRGRSGSPAAVPNRHAMRLGLKPRPIREKAVTDKTIHRAALLIENFQASSRKGRRSQAQAHLSSEVDRIWLLGALQDRAAGRDLRLHPNALIDDILRRKL